MSYKGVVLTEVVGAYGELRHGVKRGLAAVWYNVLLLGLIYPLVSRDSYILMLYLRLCVVVLALRWLIVFNAFFQFRAVKEALYRSSSVSRKMRLGKYMALKINGAWFLFKRVRGESEGRWKFNMFERVYVEGSRFLVK